MDRGYIPLYRRIMDNPLWLSEVFTRSQAWIDLLLLANHKEGSYYIRGNKIDVKRGQLGWAEKSLAARWKWSRGKVGRFLKMLENEQQIEQQKTKLTTLITIVNYEQYNGNGQQTEQQTDIRRTSDGHQTDINKNEKKGKKVNKKNIPFDEIVNHLNEKTGKSYKPGSQATQRHIRARWSEGFRLDEFRAVIDNMTLEWLADEKMSQYLRPETLFGAKFEGYLNRKQTAIIKLVPNQRKDEEEWQQIFSQT